MLLRTFCIHGFKLRSRAFTATIAIKQICLHYFALIPLKQIMFHNYCGWILADMLLVEISSQVLAMGRRGTDPCRINPPEYWMNQTKNTKKNPALPVLFLLAHLASVNPGNQTWLAGKSPMSGPEGMGVDDRKKIRDSVQHLEAAMWYTWKGLIWDLTIKTPGDFAMILRSNMGK